ncbi:hypothetical protein EG68_03352 [Paragonimus skrjabini miyazakii]|uniref:UBX domain-containing protein 1 n=1 Tax=Paragonimus skrjabini miyazakii TaxID=59628 RepID=A0A8S9Z1P3_9TREM|nr:hypothetical protein EG68_03352 [Paragonimus skrjabini miyazakii]
MPSELEHLLEMGFPKPLAEEALKCTGNNGLDAAMEWLVKHQEDNDAPEDKPQVTESDPAKSFKCEDCSKSLRNEEEVQIHSARTGHVNYSESTEEVKPLTEEERKAQMEKLQDLLRQKKLQRDAQEKQEELEREKRRRKQGKDIVSAKTKFEEDEIRRMVEQKRREKEEDKAYRERLKADIARERAEKKMKERGEDPQISPVAKPVLPPQPPKSDSTVCRLQIRLPSGPPLKAEFGPSEPLSAVILYISQRWPLNEVGSVDPSSVQVLTTFPKRDFGEGDLQMPLSELGLCPSAVLIARLKH